MTEPWSIIQNAVFGHTGCDGDMADRTASAIESALEEAGFEITPIEPPLHGYAEGIEAAAKVADAAQCRHEATYADARKLADEGAMDRCAARARASGDIAAAIRALTPKEPQP